MPSLIDIRRRIRAVKSTQQITKAMKMISASKLRRAQERVIGARPFARNMARVLTGLAARNYAGPGLVLSYVIAGLACAFAALCYAELASTVPMVLCMMRPSAPLPTTCR